MNWTTYGFMFSAVSAPNLSTIIFTTARMASSRSLPAAFRWEMAAMKYGLAFS